jgi:hypothetical protein
VSPARAARAGVLAIALAAAVTACTSSGSAPARPPASSTTPAPASSPAGLTSSTIAPASSSTTSASALASPSKPASPTITPHAPPAAPATSGPANGPAPVKTSPSTCTSVSVRVVPGGAAQGTEIAALQFTNTGTVRCRLGGFATVVLLRKGKPIGTPSQPSTTRAVTMTLQPGDIAESLLHDYSTCSAALSDSIRVTVPGERTAAGRPLQLRACTLRVDPLGPPS